MSALGGISGADILAGLIGALIGTAVGVLPGLSPTVALALLLGPTSKLSAEPGLVLLGGAFFGTQYGASVSAILVGVPSEPTAMVIGIEGYAMTRRGRPGAAVTLAAVGAFIGGVVGLILLLVVGKGFSTLIFQFGPEEITCLTAVGLIALCRISAATWAKGLFALGLGLVIPTIGLDPSTGMARFTLGNSQLLQGFSLIPVVLGLVGMAELIELTFDPDRLRRGPSMQLRELVPTREEFRQALPSCGRSSIIGFLLGLLPGPSLSIASFIAYRLESRLAGKRGLVGSGEPACVSGPKAADDAAVSGNLASLLTIGLPFTPVTAVLFVALLQHGITPGPLLFRNSPAVVGHLIIALILANIILFALNLPMIGVWTRLLRMPHSLLSAILAVLILVGSFSVRNSDFDMLTTILFGIVGYGLRRMGVSVMPLLVAMILGPVLEENFQSSMNISHGSFLIFLSRPFSVLILAIGLLVVAVPAVLRVVRRARKASKDDLEENAALVA